MITSYKSVQLEIINSTITIYSVIINNPHFECFYNSSVLLEHNFQKFYKEQREIM